MTALGVLSLKGHLNRSSLCLHSAHGGVWMKGSDRGDIPAPPRVPRGVRKGLILGFTTSHTNREMLRPILTMFPGGPCSMVFSFYFQLNSKASILWLIPVVDRGGGRSESIFPCRIAAASAQGRAHGRHVPEDRSPLPPQPCACRSPGGSLLGANFPPQHISWEEVMFVALSNLRSKQPSPAYQIYLLPVGDSDSFV